MKEIFAQRLKNARVMSNLSMDGLCAKLGGIVSKQSIHKYETGKMLPDSTVLIALSKALCVPAEYFFRPFAHTIGGIEFRKRTGLSKKMLHGIEEAVRDRADRYIAIEETCGVVEDFTTDLSDTEVCTEADVLQSAARIKTEWALGEDGICSLIATLEDHQVKVIEIDTSPKFAGLSGFIGGRLPVIVLNKGFNTEQKRFTAMHELGHLLLHFADDMSESERERLCNLFASEMLLSNEVFKRLIGDKRKDISLNELRGLQSQFGISIDALMYKAKHLGIISESRYKHYCIRKNSDERFKEVVCKSVAAPEYSDRFTRLVYRALSCGLITISRAAELLQLPFDEVSANLNYV